MSAGTMAVSGELSKMFPDPLDPVEVGGAAPDALRAAAAVDAGTDDLRDL
jgi:hypothetical protein